MATFIHQIDPMGAGVYGSCCCTPTADVRVQKTQISSGNVPTGGNALFRNEYTNLGPGAANGAILRDVPQLGYPGNWTISPFGTTTLTYSGGATGPATVSNAALLAGFTVTSFPSGGVVRAEYNIQGIAASAPGVNRNRATVTASGYTDPVAANDFADESFRVSAPPAPCSCSFDLIVAEGDIFIGNTFSGTYGPTGTSCCTSRTIGARRYNTLADAVADVNSTPAGLSFSQTVSCTSSGWETTGMPAGYYRFSATTTFSTFSCTVTEDGQILGPPPYGSSTSVNYATWPIHSVV